MNSIYYDGTKYYKVGKHKDGSYVKFEVDDVGVYKQGGSVHKYGTIADMNMDINKMYQVGGKVEDTEPWLDNIATIIKKRDSGKVLTDDEAITLGRWEKESEKFKNDPEQKEFENKINTINNGTWYQQGYNWLKDKFALENLPLGGWYKKESGGSIHINPANKGKFTASAERRGMGVQEFAHKVMANKENYSPTLVKRANFAINATKFKHESGGYLINNIYDIDENEMKRLKDLGYEFDII